MIFVRLGGITVVNSGGTEAGARRCQVACYTTVCDTNCASVDSVGIVARRGAALNMRVKRETAGLVCRETGGVLGEFLYVGIGREYILHIYGVHR